MKIVCVKCPEFIKRIIKFFKGLFKKEEKDEDDENG